MKRKFKIIAVIGGVLAFCLAFTACSPEEEAWLRDCITNDFSHSMWL